MKITDEKMEWATAHRMRDMLVNVHDDYKVTHSYALFTTILCWIMQRVRATGHADIDRRARALLHELQNEQISDPPWSIWTDGERPNAEGRRFPMRGRFTDFRGFDAARFLTALRNATAHGDARNIRPVNRNGLLIGHEFRCTERDGQPPWRGMRRIGIALADRFCAALSAPHEDQDRLHFEGEANRIREEAA